MPTKTPTPLDWSAIAAVLKTNDANAPARCKGLKLLPTCGRCGGSGHYSRNAAGDTRCYTCGGAGQRMPTAKELPAILDAANACATDGRLDAYLLYLDANKRVKNATTNLLKVWGDTGIGATYNWRNAVAAHNPNYTQRDRDLADINAKMHAAYTTVETASRKLSAKSPTYQADVIALDALYAKAVADIAAAKREMEIYLAKGESA